MDSLIQHYFPHPTLREFVRSYQVIRWSFAGDVVLPTKFLQPRPEHSIAFYVRDPQRFRPVGTTETIEYPRTILTGIQTVTLQRDCGRDFLALKIILHPSTLFRLTGIPAKELANNFIDAETLWGPSVRLVFDQLTHAHNLPEMVARLDEFMQGILGQNLRNAHPVDAVSRELVANSAGWSLDWLARQSGLSVRQFIRQFEQRVGVSPKLFGRVVRFDRVYRLKNNRPQLDWLTIALEGGYYDYQHLAKDYRDFTSTTPVGFYQLDQQAPERRFGLHHG